MAYLLGALPSPQDASFFPTWATNGALRYYDKYARAHFPYSLDISNIQFFSSNALGQWSPETGPPFVKHVTMWSDPKCVDHNGAQRLSQLIRKISDGIVFLRWS
jgi:hypothetical protein